jgi:hypothetical protein
MEDSNKQFPTELPHRQKGPDWATVALRAWLILLAVVAVIILIKMFRRGGAGMAVAMAAPAVAVASTSRTCKEREEPKNIDQDFLKLWLSRIAVEDPLMTPAELCGVLNILFQKDGRPEPFDSPSQMARELKKLGLQSSVRSVRGRSERRWYDLTGFGTHAPAQ